ncbi:MAG: hypothetical protein KAJ19_19740 [Gammaproteobacteria bacterium]|nr:hypothetical protein [Gammaproteobacteria bacterium]
MAARTDIATVKIILPAETELADDQITAAIEDATCTVDQIAAGCAAHLSVGCLTRIETNLAAHYAASTENTLSLSSETDPCCGGKVVYGFKFGEGVKGTPYGQRANTLSGGCLAEMDKQPTDLFSIGATDVSPSV